MDIYPIPKVITKVKAGKTLIRIHSFRKLTYSECQYAIKRYMRDRKIKSLPQGKTIDIFALFDTDA